MKKLTKRLFVSMAALVIASPLFAGAKTVSADSLNDTKASISSQQSAGDKLVAELDQIQGKVWSLQNKVTAKNQEIADVQDNITSSQKRLGELTGEIKTTTAELTNRKAVLREQLVELQKQSTNSVSGNIYLDFVLSGDNFTELISRSFAVNRLNKANEEAMSAVQDAKQELASLKDEQTTKQNQLVADKDKLVSEKTALDAAKADADAAAQTLQTKISENQDVLSTLKVKLNTQTEAGAKAQAQATAVAAPVKQAAATPLDNSVKAPVVNTHSGSNPYAYGECTWYAYQRTGWAGGHWGNGGQWGASAAAAGYTVNNTPEVGAIVVFAGGQNVGGWIAAPGYGHVGVVEAVTGGSITISQGGNGFSNPAGPNLQSLGSVGSYTYIHPAR
ncbi:CHAP domain-containing protein [Lapidilactobacillus wuchangensis]|uniref:CHAP domain-containing protein n=1 Tax=Lapidilactobacillus wuchangensis TaxID=2486001 RepID=UPI000F77B373|nr:CHAP domain-containing protein [Lapidilactobacillus wuchangensis]